MIVARRALDARDREEAWRTVTTPERAGGYSWGWAFADGTAAIVETTATTASDLQEATTHTNHALDGSVASDGVVMARSHRDHPSIVVE